MVIFSRYTYWLGSMLGLVLVLAAMSQVGLLGPFQGLFLTAARPFESVLNGAFQPVAAFLSDAGNVNDLQDENARLRIENEALRNKITTLQQDAQDVEELRNALGITQNGGADTKVAASVVAHDALAFTDVVQIDKGSSSGIKVGMVVLSSGGTLMGTVTTVQGNASFVRLITDSRSAVNAQVVESKADGIIQGTANRGLAFNFSQADVKVGDTIVTSGLGGNYPPDIPIGRVSAVGGTPQDLYRKVDVEPQVRLSTTRTVLVDITFIPSRIDLEAP